MCLKGDTYEQVNMKNVMVYCNWYIYYLDTTAAKQNNNLYNITKYTYSLDTRPQQTEDGPTVNQHWVNVLYLLGRRLIVESMSLTLIQRLDNARCQVGFYYHSLAMLWIYRAQKFGKITCIETISY